MSKRSINSRQVVDTERGTITTQQGAEQVVESLKNQSAFNYYDRQNRGNEKWKDAKADLAPSVTRNHKR